MNTPKHTPGPWTHLGWGDIHGHEANGGGVDIAAVYLREEDEKWLANARLIAAAPDLLEALKACDEAMAYMSEYDIPLTLPDQVKAAISKATGGAT